MGKVVVVAVKAAKEIPRTALVWALTHVVQPGDCIRLLVVVPTHSSKKIWGLSRFTSDCTRYLSGQISDQKDNLADSCSQMMLQLRYIYDPQKVKIKIKVVSGSPCGVIATEAKKAQSNWVILDKYLNHQKKYCLEELQCNLVVMKRSQPKVLRLNLVDSTMIASEMNWPNQSDVSSMPFMTPASSPDHDLSVTTTDIGTSSVSSSDPGTSPFLSAAVYEGLKKGHASIPEENQNQFESDSDSEKPGPSTKSYFPPHNPDIQSNGQQKSVREVISFSKKAPAGPPPLCSICQHKAPGFGNPPRWFAYTELEFATDAFSQANFLAEGGYGSVHKGMLLNGQVIAVKQHKLASYQGDQEFCSEVEVLSCAQHRNVVMLIGFCIEAGKRLLVYEYVCNGSLDSHLYGEDREPLEWSARQKIAVGAARGLRYLHEECRVGCIVHRDMRPNNILLTHDFEPLVGDFGLARWQPDGDLGVETRIIGRFGYLAPEYAQSGQITEKADVYSFGVVLIELITGRKAMDLKRPRGQQCLTEWARPLLQKRAIHQLLDPRLQECNSKQEVYNMLQCAFLCVRRDPHSRPRMSQVLRILEGDIMMDSSCFKA